MQAPRDAIRFDGEPIGGLPPGEIVRRGIALVPEGRRLFPSLSVEENLLMGAHAKRAGPWNLQRAVRDVPDPRAEAPPARHRRCRAASSRWSRSAARLMSNPTVLLCDELSLGLAPIVIREIYAAMPAITAEGMTVVIVEQDVATAQQGVAARVLLPGRPGVAARPLR